MLTHLQIAHMALKIWTVLKNYERKTLDFIITMESELFQLMVEEFSEDFNFYRQNEELWEALAC